jgi:hypothetical protein
MITSTGVPVNVSPQAATRVTALGLDADMHRMIDHVRNTVPELSRIEVVLYERDEPGEPPGIGVEAYAPFEQFEQFDSTAQTRKRLGEWLVAEFPSQTLEHLTIDYLPETPAAG